MGANKKGPAPEAFILYVKKKLLSSKIKIMFFQKFGDAV